MRRTWKEYYFTDGDQYRWMESGWQSSYEAFGRDKHMFFQHPSFLITNLSDRDVRRLARSVGARVPDYVTASDPRETNDEDDAEYERDLAERRAEHRRRKAALA